MKWAFVILLMMNMVYFGVELDHQTRINVANARQALIVPRGVKTLKLLREQNSTKTDTQSIASTNETADAGSQQQNEMDTTLTNMEETADVRIAENFASELVSQMPDFSVPNNVNGASADTTMCLSYGPFPNNRQVGELIDWFKEHQVVAQQRMETDENQQLFWIYLEPQSSRDNAIQAIEDLKNKGIKDYRLIETGDLQNAISLGLYSTQASVNKRLNELTSSGYQPVVVPYRDSRAIYWVDVKLVNQPDMLSQMFTDLPSRFNSVPVDCTQIALN